MKAGNTMGNNKSKTLYHYCSLDTFLSIIKNSSIWLSDVQKSNDCREMAWFRQQYYEFLLNKYNSTEDEDVKTVCQIIFSIAAKDGFDKCPKWLLPAVNINSQKLIDIFLSLRTYAFCLSEKQDSLGQWRGYANDGEGIAIGFSQDYLDAITGYGLRCPKFNFLLGNVSYKKNLNSLFEKMFQLHDKTKSAEFVLLSLLDLTHTSALFKHPSFSEEKEWRIIYSMDDLGITQKDLLFEDFYKICCDKYHENFETPSIDYIVKDADIIPHIEIKIKNLNKAINHIIIGPKCNVTEKDIRHILLKSGVINSFNDKSIKILSSKSSYR